MFLLEVDGLALKFGSLSAVAGVDFSVKEGEIFGLIGPDGAGKTTTLRLLVGVLDAQAGRVRVGGIDVAREPDKARELLGYMPQQYSLYGDLSVEENLRFFADMHFVSGKEFRDRRRRLYQFSRLEPYSTRRAGQLSGGMYKKLALSCSLIHSPRLLILDEPTTGVDPLSRRELWDILYSLAGEGTAIVLSTPYMDEAERCHRVGLMSEGRLLAADEPGSILARFKDRVFEVGAEDLEAALAVLERAPCVRRCYLVGSVVRAVAPADTGSEPLRIMLDKAGVAAALVEETRPTFEDVFLAFQS
jgi:ABC-2 type transport system ATP-binding protein